MNLAKKERRLVAVDLGGEMLELTSIQQTILKAVATKDRTAYELQKCFKLNHATAIIYSKKLVDLGLLRYREVAEVRVKVFYSITADGLRAIVEATDLNWFSEFWNELKKHPEFSNALLSDLYEEKHEIAYNVVCDWAYDGYEYLIIDDKYVVYKLVSELLSPRVDGGYILPKEAHAKEKAKRNEFIKGFFSAHKEDIAPILRELYEGVLKDCKAKKDILEDALKVV